MHKNANKVTLLAGKYGDAPTPTIEPLNQTDFAFYDEYENSTTAGTTVYALWPSFFFDSALVHTYNTSVKNTDLYIYLKKILFFIF